MKHETNSGVAIGAFCVFMCLVITWFLTASAPAPYEPPPYEPPEGVEVVAHDDFMWITKTKVEGKTLLIVVANNQMESHIIEPE